MKGKTVVITGGTSGIGEIAAERLAQMGARIVLIARDKSRGEATLARLHERAPGLGHAVHYADLARIPEMKRVAAEIAHKEPRIDVLINNAGAMFSSRRLTEDGLEYTFALNHMAYFVVTEGLRERLLASSPARIVNVSSAAHQGARLDFDDLQSAKGFGAMKAYGRSKLCNILFTRELARRLHGTGVTANCLHPGFVATRFGDQSGGVISRFVGLAKLFAISPEKGAETIIYLASSAALTETTGVYFYKCRPITPSQAAMRISDLVVATGGAGMVKAAYSSGTPAYGVGVGNAVHVVDETADLDDAAQMIANAKTFDYATSCLADNSVAAHSSIYETLKRKLVERGGHVCAPAEKARLQAVMWPKDERIPSIEVVAKPAAHIAELAGIEIAPDRRFLVVEDEGTGEAHPFSGEKLSVVLALYRYRGGIDGAVDLVNQITQYQGAGHTCGIHSSRNDHVLALALGTKTARVMVNQSMNEGAGSVRNGLPYTLSLSCGSWGGNITTENINVRHFVNLTWVSRPVAPRRVVPEEIFGVHWSKYGNE